MVLYRPFTLAVAYYCCFCSLLLGTYSFYVLRIYTLGLSDNFVKLTYAEMSTGGPDCRITRDPPRPKLIFRMTEELLHAPLSNSARFDNTWRIYNVTFVLLSFVTSVRVDPNIPCVCCPWTLYISAVLSQTMFLAHWDSAVKIITMLRSNLLADDNLRDFRKVNCYLVYAPSKKW